MEKLIEMSPAYDKRHQDPKKNYGVGSVSLRFILKGSEGAVQFLLYTNWNLPQVQAEFDRNLDGRFPHLSCHPLPADLGYHSPKPRHKDQQPMQSNGDKGCEYLDGKPCYYDGSGMRAYGVYKTLLEEGSDGVWKVLECEYRRLFLATHVEDDCICASADDYRVMKGIL